MRGRNPYSNLAEQIVASAVKDWKDAMEILDVIPEDISSWETVLECEDFFRSDWYQTLRELSPDAIPVNMISFLKERVNDK